MTTIHSSGPDPTLLVDEEGKLTEDKNDLEIDANETLLDYICSICCFVLPEDAFKVVDTYQEEKQATRRGSRKAWYERSDSKKVYITTDEHHFMEMVFFETSNHKVDTGDDSMNYRPHLPRMVTGEDDDEFDKKPQSEGVSVAIIEKSDAKQRPKEDSVGTAFFKEMDEKLKPLDSPVCYREELPGLPSVYLDDVYECEDKSKPQEDLLSHTTIEAWSMLNKLSRVLFLTNSMNEKIFLETVAGKPVSEKDPVYAYQQLPQTSLHCADECVSEVPTTEEVTETAKPTLTFIEEAEMPAMAEVAETKSPTVATAEETELPTKDRSFGLDGESMPEEDLLCNIIIVQSLVRRLLARNMVEQKRCELMIQCATTIQSAWRGYYFYSSYQCDLRNIIIVQNLVRRLTVRNVAEQKRRELIVHSATAIQTAWRGYYTYLSYQFDCTVNSVKSFVHRQKIAEQKRSALMVHSATAIQSAWRGYFLYASYQCDLHNIAIVQSLVRCLLAARKVTEKKRRKLMVQSATAIQTAWRAYYTYARNQCELCHIIIVQSFVRRQVAKNVAEQKRRELLDQSAIAIQTAWRGYFAYSIYQV